MQLQIHKLFWIDYANQKYNYSGIRVTEGEEYLFYIDLNQVWYDSDIATSPKGWDRKHTDLGFLSGLFVKLKEDDRRCPKAKWFEIIGTIGKSDKSPIRLLKHTEMPLKVDKTGDFYAFANDLDRMYGNNLGSISVSLTRTR